MAKYPLPLEGYPKPQRGGQNHNGATSGPRGSIIGVGWGVHNALERRTESKVAHKWARWLCNPCRLGGAERLKAGDIIINGPQVGQVATKPLPPGGPQRTIAE